MTRFATALFLCTVPLGLLYVACGDSGESAGPACVGSAIQCDPSDPTVVQQCVDDKWTELTTCTGGQVCDGAGACASACTPLGGRRCSPLDDLIAQSCDSSGAWLDDAPCDPANPCRLGACDPWTAPTELNDWRILFNYRGRISGQNDTENELWMMDDQGNGKQSLTDLGGLKDLDPPLSCDFGCIVSPDLKWIAVVDGPATATGFNLKFGKFNADLEVVLLKGKTFKDIVDFQFAGDRLFYTTQKSCQGAACQYDLFVVMLAENVNQETLVLTFPPDADIEGSTYRGHFKTSKDGSKIVLLNTTIRSVEPFMWKDGSGLISLDYVCKFGTKGDCSGTGSEYSDVDPVAISPDGRWVVFFTFSDKWQRARIYDTENPGQIQQAILASVTSGSYIEKACDAGVLADWQWERVTGNPQFTADGEDIIFLTETTCTADGSQPVKPRTNLRRIKLGTLLSGKTIEEIDVLNLTKNPFGDVTANKRTTGFFVSPDGATVVFTASPIEASNGTPIGDGQARQRNDREVFRMNLKGENLKQITNDLAFKAESPQIVEGATQ